VAEAVSAPDLLVVGGGVIGLACALEIDAAHPGLRIAILDRPAAAGKASRAAAGMLAPWAEFGADGPLYRMCVRSLGRYPGFLAQHAPHVRLHQAGTLVPSDPGNSRSASREAFLRGTGLRFDVLEGAGLRRAEPALSPSITRALLLPEALIHPAALHEALLARAATRGIALSPADVAEVRTRGSRIGSVRLDDGSECTPGHVLLATGAWSAALGERFRVAIPVHPVKGQLAVLAAPEGLLRHTVHTHEAYAAPRAGHGIVVGATMEEAGFDTSAPAEVTARLIEASAALVPALAGLAVREAHVGFRPRTADGLPVIGRSSRWENLFIATGHFRNGILLTPETGAAVARLYAGDAGEGLDAFAPSRFGA
jgi:glycine oxidase